MSLTKEELLIPRAMCVGTEPGTPNYPGSEFNTGDILMETIRLLYSKVGQESCRISKGMLDRFPHLFRPMPWWEGRKIEDMPEYLIFLSENGITEFVLKVEKYLFHKDTNQYWAFEYLWENERDLKRMSLAGWMPATEQEYLEYQKEKEDK